MAVSAKTFFGGDNKVNNVWKRIKRRYIYRNGVQSEPLVTFHWDNGSSYNPQGTTTFYDSYISSVCSKTDIRQGAITDSTIDLSNYDSLSMSCAISTDNAVHGFVGVSNDKTTVSSLGTRLVTLADGTVSAVVTYDTSDITTARYVVFGASSGWAGTNVGEVKTYSVWLDSGAWEYVTDKNENKYPDGDILGEYYYERVSVDVGPIMNLFIPTAPTQDITINGSKLTNNSDGTYTLNGTYTSTSGKSVAMGTYSFKANTTYKLSGTPKGTMSFLYVNIDGSQRKDIGNGVVFTPTTDTETTIWLWVNPDEGFANNVVFKPMITTNLKATYHDFEKGIEGTKFARGTLTLSSATNKLFITHGLGVVPKAFAIYATVSSYRSYTWNAFYDASYDTKAYVGRSNVVQAIQFNSTESDTSYNFKDSNKIGVVQYSSSYAWQAGTYEWIAVG